jgi:hypothetical protein
MHQYSNAKYCRTVSKGDFWENKIDVRMFKMYEIQTFGIPGRSRGVSIWFLEQKNN